MKYVEHLALCPIVQLMFKKEEKEAGEMLPLGPQGGWEGSPWWSQVW